MRQVAPSRKRQANKGKLSTGVVALSDFRRDDFGLHAKRVVMKSGGKAEGFTPVVMDYSVKVRNRGIESRPVRASLTNSIFNANNIDQQVLRERGGTDADTLDGTTQRNRFNADSRLIITSRISSATKRVAWAVADKFPDCKVTIGDDGILSILPKSNHREVVDMILTSGRETYFTIQTAFCGQNRPSASGCTKKSR